MWYYLDMKDIISQVPPEYKYDGGHHEKNEKLKIVIDTNGENKAIIIGKSGDEIVKEWEEKNGDIDVPAYLRKQKKKKD